MADRILVLFCAACGKVFRYERSNVVDPNHKAPDGGPVVYDALCYKGPDTSHEAALPEDGLVPEFRTDQDVQVYSVSPESGHIPDILAHGRVRREVTRV